MRVLIVEDEKIKRITMTDALLMEGYDVVAVENPIEALNVFKTKEFDVVITDIRLPHMSGLDFLREIKSLKPDATVLIIGESGTGKELIANAIHYNSPRKDKPLIKCSCAALVETLLESELFGHERGAFTGAVKERKGRFELSNGG